VQITHFFGAIQFTIRDNNPFGLNLKGDFTKNISTKRLYNFKEKISDFGLGWADFGERYYLGMGDGVPRFLGVDPISEQFAHVSTYNYAENSPINAIDLHGLQKYVVIFSPIQTQKLTTAFKNNNFKEIERIGNHALNNGFVNNAGTPSDFMDRKAAASGIRIQDRPNWQESSGLLLPNGNRPNIYDFIGVDVDENFNIVGFKYLGQLNYNQINYSAWVEFIKNVDNPNSYTEEFRTASLSMLNGKTVNPPPNKQENLSWPLGAFSLHPWLMNRTGQARDIASWAEFLDDYKKNNEKYDNAIYEYLRRYYQIDNKEEEEEEN
jgi:RHS repeat-associated protein